MHALVLDAPPMRLLLFTGREKHALGELITSATHAIIADQQMAEDNARWLRLDQRAIKLYRDGLTLDAVVVPPALNMAAKMLPPSRAKANRQWLADTRDIHVATAPLLGIIAVRDLYDRQTALAAGRLWQRLHLKLTASGLVAQPLNQPAERVDREHEHGAPAHTAEALAAIIGDPSWRPTFLFRAGYASRPARLSPRRALEAVIASHALRSHPPPHLRITD